MLKKVLPFIFIMMLGTLAEAKDTHLIILSGQSNMGNMDPSVSLKPIMRAAFPDDDMVFVKGAWGGNSIRKWIDKGVATKHFTDVTKLAETALNGKEPSTVTFLWMQGEADHDTTKTNSVSTIATYKKSLEALIKMFDDQYKPDMNVVIGRLNDARLKPGTDEWRVKNWTAIRNIQMQVAKEHPRGAWVPTDDVNDDYIGSANTGYTYSKGQIGYDVHGSDLGYKRVGIRFAIEAIELISGVRIQIDEDTFVPRCKDGQDTYNGKWKKPIIDPLAPCTNDPVELPRKYVIRSK
ncbi:sialate O-acetylesterase [Labilibacter sediminis]|nr:sialate O-acetylesterase [Labilibacter sediminis]